MRIVLKDLSVIYKILHQTNVGSQHNFTPSPCCAFSGPEWPRRREWVHEVGWKNATVPSGERLYDIPSSQFTVLNVVAPLTLS